MDGLPGSLRATELDGGFVDSLANRHTRAHADFHVDSDLYSNRHTDANGHADFHSNGYRHVNAVPYSDKHSCADENPYPHAGRNP